MGGKRKTPKSRLAAAHLATPRLMTMTLHWTRSSDISWSENASRRPSVRSVRDADPCVGRKQCDLCVRSVDLLVRCIVDESQHWRMVCGRCWRDVSGGVPDGDAAH